MVSCASGCGGSILAAEEDSFQWTFIHCFDPHDLTPKASSRFME